MYVGHTGTSIYLKEFQGSGKQNAISYKSDIFFSRKKTKNTEFDVIELCKYI